MLSRLLRVIFAIFAVASVGVVTAAVIAGSLLLLVLIVVGALLTVVIVFLGLLITMIVLKHNNYRKEGREAKAAYVLMSGVVVVCCDTPASCYTPPL